MFWIQYVLVSRYVSRFLGIQATKIPGKCIYYTLKAWLNSSPLQGRKKELIPNYQQEVSITFELVYRKVFTLLIWINCLNKHCIDRLTNHAISFHFLHAINLIDYYQCSNHPHHSRRWKDSQLPRTNRPNWILRVSAFTGPAFPTATIKQHRLATRSLH